ncbi:MAG: MFS transporter [Alphaproteobacteria bacterium]|nr:MFS transporter [Alphaproteobacteria bacterium]
MTALAEDPRALDRDVRVMAAIGVAHGQSHFFQLALPPFFPLLKTAFDVSYTELGAAMTAFYVASALGQFTAGFLVDRFGAVRVLGWGLGLLCLGAALIGVAPGYWTLWPAMLLMGIGNSVFHPADFAILNASVAPARLGRAYSIHGFTGALGYATAPAVGVALGALVGWRAGMMAIAVVGAVAALGVLSQRAYMVDHRRAAEARPSRGLERDLRDLMTQPILLCFAFFTLWSAALIGLQTFSVSALRDFMAVEIATGTAALTAFLLASAVGMLGGGWVADHWPRHEIVALAGMTVAAAVILAVGLNLIGPGLLIAAFTLAGFMSGATSPSRDMIVRKATPLGASGKVYGFVYSGLDVGSSLAPLGFGLALDFGRPDLVFLVSAVILAIGSLTVIQVGRGATQARTA